MIRNLNKDDDTYKFYGNFLNKELNKALDDLIVGRKQSRTLGMFTTFFLLMQIRSECYTSIIVTDEDLDCMREKIMCNGINISYIEDMYQQGCDDIQTIPPTLDGIGYMEIEGDGVLNPVNRINDN